MPPASRSVSAFQPHDHRACRMRGRAAVEAECRARKLRLTPARAFVLDALLEGHHALSAYELLGRLRSAGLGREPPIVYRALDFLTGHGFAHRLERLGAYVACAHPATAHAAAFMVCRACRTVAETALAAPDPALAAAAGATGFAVERLTLEAEGLCARCRAQGRARSRAGTA